MDYRPSVTSEDFSPDDLIAGPTNLVSDTITLITGQNLTRGALLGKITASGKYNLSLSAAADGSQTPVAILATDTDATAADEVTGVYIKGEFNERKVVFGAAHTAASTKVALRDLGIFLKPSVAG